MSQQSPQPPLSQIPNPIAPGGGQGGGPGGGQERRICPPFSVTRFRNELMLDRVARWGLVIMVIAAMLIFQTGLSAGQMWLMMLPVIVAWFAISVPSAKVMRLLPQMTGWIDQDPEGAEAIIAISLARRPLNRPVRLELYHRLAILRHTQGRFDESIAIIEALLTQPLGIVERYRSQLLLMLVEARLAQSHLPGAYVGLVELSKQRLSLIEALGRLSLRTWYEVSSGYDGQALAGLPDKIQMAQMMPAGPCGQMHLLLAAAAGRHGDLALYDWLKRRAELLCEPAQFEAFVRGQWQYRPAKPTPVATL